MSHPVEADRSSMIHEPVKENPANFTESMDFEDLESVVWRKHQLRRFFQDRGQWWTNSRRTTAWKWILIVVTGVIIGLMGYFVSFFTDILTEFKYESVEHLIEHDNWAGAFFAFIFFGQFYSLLAGLLCMMEPVAAGSGIPEIKAYLNGINLNRVVNVRVLIPKVLGMCFSVSAGLPCGKEGPMIHAGAVVGAAVSQGKSFAFGFDTSWTKFQDLRNDRSKRDFVTFGASAGVAAAFSAPIGGILFTLEEGASFWSTSLTFRAFFCALITELTLSLVTSGFQLGTTNGYSLFAFGVFDDFSGYATYELFIFALMGIGGGILGALFNFLNKKVTIFRRRYAQDIRKRLLELLLITFVMSLFCFVLSLMWTKCTPVPTNTADWTSQQLDLLDDLVTFQCEEHHYNQLASLLFTSADVAMQQLYHFREIDGTNYITFETGSLIIFFIFYFVMASITSGTLAPTGLFVPSLLVGASYGRIVGHILNCILPGFVTDSGSYALIGAACMLGGMARMTIAGCVIVLEACGNSAYLLPLMVCFAAARYSGNAINQPMYDMHISLKEWPFLEGNLKTLGLLNYHPIAELMAQPVVTLREINKVSYLHYILSNYSHNGFPVVDSKGYLKGFILRKTLCNIIKLKGFSTPLEVTYNSASSQNTGGIYINTSASSSSAASPATGGDQFVKLSIPPTIFYDTMERNYPKYPNIKDISLSPTDLNCYLDLRPYMDTSPYTINSSASVQKSYRFFRTMGLRHLIIIENNGKVCGIITRKDITEHRLEHHWFEEGDNMQKFINVNPLEAQVLTENYDGELFDGEDEEGHTMANTLINASSDQATFNALNDVQDHEVTRTATSSTRNRDVKSGREPRSIRK